MKRAMVAAACMVVAVTVAAGRAHAQAVWVPGFSPSENGFQFSNNTWPHEPYGVINVAGVNVSISDASNGMCGGMVYAVRDYYESGYHVPLTGSNPAYGTPLFSYIEMRLFDTFTPSMVARLYGLQASPFDSDRKNTMQAEWPLIQASLDAGHLTPLQLVRLRWDVAPWDLGKNHQVLAYGYELMPVFNKVMIYIYDPNHPTEDKVTIIYDYANPSAIQSSGEPLYSFFREDYSPAAPPATQTWTNGFEGADAGVWWLTGNAGILTSAPGAAHRGNGLAWLAATTGWNEVITWVPTLPNRTCTMQAYVRTTPQRIMDAHMTMRSATPSNNVLADEHITWDWGHGQYWRYHVDFLADGWWGKLSVGLLGTGQATWLFFDDVTVVCEAW
jgi:hypothetical protein